MEYNSNIVFFSILCILFIIFIILTVRKAKAKTCQHKKLIEQQLIVPSQSVQQPKQDDPTILDRQYLTRETPSLLPANEIQQTNYKDWNTTAEKEIYSSDAPMFNQNGPINLVTPDINSTQRRVNFY